jgi:hypothetical protein
MGSKNSAMVQKSIDDILNQKDELDEEDILE